MAVAQGLRLVIRPHVLIAGRTLPLWPSAVAFLVLGGLSTWVLRLAAKPGA